MNEFRLSPEAEAQLDSIWLHIAQRSSSVDTANRAIDDITDRFWLLSRNPYMGRRRDDLALGLRSFPAGDYLIIHRIQSGGVLLVLFVVHGSQDIGSFFQH